MVLPIYDPDITPEEALSQFEFATSRLVLFPRGKRNIRDHVFDAATDTALASSRFIGALEKTYKKNSSLDIADRFLEGINRSLVVIERMRILYDNMELIEEEPLELETLKRERSLVESYASLMSLRRTYAREMIRDKDK